MGANYSVELNLKFADKAGAAKALYGYVCNSLLPRSPHCFDEEGEVVESVERLFSVLLASSQNDFEHRINNDGSEYFFSDFHATYSWSAILDEAFEAIVPYLQDGSTYYQLCENDEDKYEIIGGKQVLIQSNWR